MSGVMLIMCTFNELRCKEVINIRDGRKLGYVDDAELETVGGNIISLIIPGPGKFFGLFGRGEAYVVAWKDIEKIGDDIILVNCASSFQSGQKKSSGGFFSSLFNKR